MTRCLHVFKWVNFGSPSVLNCLPSSAYCRLLPSVRLLGERVGDGGFQFGGDLLVVADEVADEAAAAVEDEGLRDGRLLAEEEADGLVVGLGELVLDAVEPDELGHLGAVFVAADVEPDDLEPLRPELLLELDEVRNLFAARRAVGRPEVEHDDLPAQVFEALAAAVELRPRAARRRARAYRDRLAVRRGDRRHRQVRARRPRLRARVGRAAARVGALLRRAVELARGRERDERRDRERDGGPRRA